MIFEVFQLLKDADWSRFPSFELKAKVIPVFIEELAREKIARINSRLKVVFKKLKEIHKTANERKEFITE